MKKTYKRHITGKMGEDLAIEYLKGKEYKIIERNFQCKQGEIDIIAKDKGELVIIEVKTRNSLDYGKPAESITNIKKNHIYKTAQYYLYINDLEDIYVRIDVIEVYMKSNKYFINHIKNVDI